METISTDGVHARLYRRFDDATLVEAWQFIQEATVCSPFAGHWWVLSQTEAGGEPLAVVAFKGSLPIAVAAFSLHDGRLMIAAGEFRDYGDWVCTVPDKRRCAEVVAGALPWGEIHRIRITGMLGGDPLGDALYEQASRNGMHGWLGQIDQAPKLSLVGQDGARFTSYRFVFKSKNSKRLKIALEKKGSVEYSRVKRLEDIGPAVERLAELHVRRWATSHTPSGFSEPSRRKVLRQIAESALRAGCLHWCELRLDGKPISSSMGYVIGNSYGFHAVAFNANVPGISTIRSHLAYLLDDLAASTEITCFDFLSGGEEYKLALATSTESLRILDVRRNCVQGFVARLKGCVFEGIYRRPEWYSKAQKAKQFALDLRRRAMVPFVEFRRVRNEFGMRTALGKVFRALVARWYDDTTLVVTSLPLARSVPLSVDKSDDDIQISPGGFLDYAELIRIRFGSMRSAMALAYDERTEGGMKLYIVRAGGYLVGGGWLQIGGEYAPTEIGGQRVVRANVSQDGYVVDVWIAPQQRGRKLLSRLLLHISDRALTEGLSGHLHAVIDLRNMASRRGFEKFGFVEGEYIQR